MQQVAYKYANTWKEQVDAPGELHARRVVKTTRQHNQHRKILVKCGLLVFAYAILLVFLCTKSAGLGYDIDNLNKDISKIATANHRLEYQIAQQSSLGRIEKIATTELGMQNADLKNAIAMQVDSQPIQVASQPTAATNMSEKPLYKIYTSLSHLAQKDL